jgi:hypothetical protein
VANGVSDDGLTIVGYGTNPSGDEEGWVAVLGTPSPVPSPTNGLAVVTTVTRDCARGLASFAKGTAP